MNAWERGVVLAFIIGAGVMFARWRENAEREGRRRVLLDREQITLPALYTRYYSSSGIPASFVESNWREIGVELDVDPGLLRPEDRLEELMCVPGWLGTDGFTVVEWLVNRVWSLVPAADDAECEVETVDDVIRVLWRYGRSLVPYDR